MNMSQHVGNENIKDETEEGIVNRPRLVKLKVSRLQDEA
jgi:hypothetical protein